MGIAVMEKHKYLEKCMSLLTTKHFKQVDGDPTKKLESKVQRSLRKLKSKLPHINTRNYIQQVYANESFMELQSYINFQQHSHTSFIEAPIESTVSIERIRIQHQKYKTLHLENKKRTHTSRI